MERAEWLDLLGALTRLPGPSGQEEGVAAWIRQAVAPLVARVGADPFGNLVAWRPGSRPGAPAVLLAAHMDQVGLAVRTIRDDGFLRVEKLGGLDNRVLLGRPVAVLTRKGPVPGVLGVKGYHLHGGLERRAPPVEELYVDVGATSGAEVARRGVAVGDAVVLVGDLMALGDNRVAAPALDDRAGCAALVALLRTLQGRPLPGDLYVAFTAQEEVGTRGARYLAHRMPVDMAVAVDTAPAEDTPDTPGEGLRLGAGPAIKRLDAGLVAHPAVVRRLEAAAARAGVAWQGEARLVGATDARDLQLAAAAGGVSIPVRYGHSPVELLDLGDLQGAVQILAAFLLDL